MSTENQKNKNTAAAGVVTSVQNASKEEAAAIIGKSYYHLSAEFFDNMVRFDTNKTVRGHQK